MRVHYGSFTNNYTDGIDSRDSFVYTEDNAFFIIIIFYLSDIAILAYSMCHLSLDSSFFLILTQAFFFFPFFFF